MNEVIDWLTRYYEEDGCPWSYRRGTKAINTAYRGLHRLDLLLAACEKEKIKQGRISNTEIVRFGAPLAFGRSTQVFDLPPRRFPFGQNRYAAYRVPFFFVENNIVKLYFLQPRKEHGLKFDQMGMVAKIYKDYLLDSEFCGQSCNIEYVDLGILEKRGARIVRS